MKKPTARRDEAPSCRSRGAGWRAAPPPVRAPPAAAPPVAHAFDAVAGEPASRSAAGAVARALAASLTAAQRGRLRRGRRSRSARRRRAGGARPCSRRRPPRRARASLLLSVRRLSDGAARPARPAAGALDRSATPPSLSRRSPLAVVGTRRCRPTASASPARSSRRSRGRRLVVSGMARGIDGDRPRRGARRAAPRRSPCWARASTSRTRRRTRAARPRSPPQARSSPSAAGRRPHGPARSRAATASSPRSPVPTLVVEAGRPAAR